MFEIKKPKLSSSVANMMRRGIINDNKERCQGKLGGILHPYSWKTGSKMQDLI